MSNTWFTSDIHEWHHNIIRYSNRPFSSVEEMRVFIVSNWNTHVKEYDHVYILGDVGFVPYEKLKEFLLGLNGIKHLIIGNHDNNLVKNRKDLEDNKIFNTIDYYKELSFDKQKIVLCHYPMRSWNGSNHGSWMLHGHCHGALPPHGKSVDVGVDSPYITGKPEYRPFSFAEIRQFMESRDMVQDYAK